MTLIFFVRQQYKVHHDFIAQHGKKPCGPRILTFFLYLNTVEDGGETWFPTLKNQEVKVKPVKGRAILWPSVLDSDLEKPDHQTFHAALPVKKGVKHAVNAWIHLYDFETAYELGCTG